MSALRSKLLASTFVLPLALSVSGTARAQTLSPTITRQGLVGQTSYYTLPFVSKVIWDSWGSSPGLSPVNLFWQYGNIFNNGNTMVGAQIAAQSYTARGTVPASGSQRWEDTFEASQPASLFPGEPFWIAADRNANCCSSPEFKAWVNWVKARPNLPIMANDGGQMGFDFRPWHGSWGHISPLMPLAAADCPPGMASCTYGDWYAYQWGQTAARSGAYGIMLSDFSDSQPSQMSTVQGFNPEIIAGFQKTENITVPPGTTAQQSAWIDANAIGAWNDYLALGYANFYHALAQQLAAATGHAALVHDQCGDWPAWRRFYGNDQRLMRTHISTANYTCIWDDQTVQMGRSGKDPIWGLGGYAIAAAREPDMRNGANLEANDPAYWQAIASFNPSLSAADQQEKGLKLLKRSWLEGSWAHVATRGSGVVRRALAFISRDYWDAGQIDPTVQTLITTIFPTAPFGMAVYYSVAAERALEPQVAAGNLGATYYNPDGLMAFKNAGVPVDYFVSDAALPALQQSAKPAAWVVLEHPELIPANEMQMLQAIAPVLTSVQQVQSFTGAPLSFSPGLTGMAFYDQSKRLILTVTNPSTGNLSGTVTLTGLAAGTYSMLDLFANQTTSFTVSSNQVALPIQVARWDTMAFAIKRD
jgi:hypothetical protein